MGWTIEQREQAARIVIAKRFPLLTKDPACFELEVGRWAATGFSIEGDLLVDLQCELTAALSEIERLKKVAELHNDSAVEAWHLTRKWQARCQELEQSAPPQMGELAVGGQPRFVETGGALWDNEGQSFWYRASPTPAPEDISLPAPPSGEQAAAPLENESETPNA